MPKGREKYCETQHAGSMNPLKYVALIPGRCPEKQYAPTNGSQTCPSSGWALLREFKGSVTILVADRAVQGGGVAAGVLVAEGRD